MSEYERRHHLIRAWAWLLVGVAFVIPGPIIGSTFVTGVGAGLFGYSLREVYLYSGILDIHNRTVSQQRRARLLRNPLLHSSRAADEFRPQIEDEQP